MPSKASKSAVRPKTKGDGAAQRSGALAEVMPSASEQTMMQNASAPARQEAEPSQGKELKREQRQASPGLKRGKASSSDERASPADAPFDELLQQLQGALRRLQEWGQQEGLSTLKDQQEASSSTHGASQRKDEAADHVKSGASEPKLKEKSNKAFGPAAPMQGRWRDNNMGHQESTDNLMRILSPNQQAQLCDVWEEDLMAREDSRVDDPNLSRRISSGSFFGGGNEADSWKNVIRKKKGIKNKKDEDAHWTKRIILPPYAKRRAIWESCGVFLLGWDMFFVPFQTFATAAKPLDNGLVHMIEMFSLAYWTLDIAFCFFVGFYRKDGMVEMQFSEIARHYLKRWFCFDVACVCMDYGIKLMQWNGVKNFRLVRLLRVVKFKVAMRSFLSQVRSNRVLIILGMTKNMAMVLIMNHMIACGWHWIGTSYTKSSESWVQTWLTDPDDGELRSLSYRYCTSVQWAITQLGVGAVEIHPKNSAERLYATLVGISALIMSSVLVSSVTGSMLQLQELGQIQKEQDQALRSYLTNRHISQRLQGHIWAFLKKARKQDKNKGTILTDVSAISNIPGHMALSLRLEVYMPYMLNHAFFSMHIMDIQQGGSMSKTTRDLIGIFQEVQVGQEEDLFRTNDKAEKMQFIASGEVLYKSRLETDSRGITLEAQDWLSEQALWLNWQHVGRAMAKVSCEMFVLHAAEFQKVMKNEIGAKAYAKMFVERIRSNKDPVTDVMGSKEDIRSWQQEIALAAFNVSATNAPEAAAFRPTVSERSGIRPSLLMQMPNMFAAR